MVADFEVHLVWVLVDHARHEEVLPLDIHIRRPVIEPHRITRIHVDIASMHTHPIISPPHLLRLLVLILLLYPNLLQSFLPHGYILRRSDMDINLHTINNILSLQIVGDLGAELAFLGEEIFEEDDYWRLHLFEDVLVDDLFGYFVPCA